jgi:hypothetical protein
MTWRKKKHDTYQNSNGGWYQKGRVFMMPKRLEIGYQYLDLCIDKYPKQPTHLALATQAKISESYARKLIIELKNNGLLTDPEATNSEKRREKEKEYYLDPAEEFFCWLSGLRAQYVPTMITVHSWHCTMALLCQPVLFPCGSRQGLTTRVHSANQILFLLTSLVKRM